MIVVALALVSCGAPAGPSSGSPCTPGMTVACACVGGSAGIQVCNQSGTYNACQCAAVDSGTDATPIDVGALDSGFDVVTPPPVDVPGLDATPIDVGALDSGFDVVTPPPVDVPGPDATPIDVGVLDSGFDVVSLPMDVSRPDAGLGDVGALDSGVDVGTCVSGQTRCGGVCVDTRVSPLHCGACDRPCPSGQTCEGGTCRPPAVDCRTGGCPAMNYCDLGTGTCRPGCADDSHCAATERCDFATRTCGCSTDTRRCGDVCVDTRTSSAHCGACGRACTASQSCAAGVCAEIATDCRVVPCRTGTYCNLGDGLCRPGCLTDPECPQPGTCDTSHVCRCATATHLCGDVCRSDTSPASCGTACSPCPSPANAVATCTGGVCGSTCNAGFHLCGGACVTNNSVMTCGASCTPCPTDPSGTATCDGTRCGITCNAGFHLCGGACVSNNSVATCGASCTPCPSTDGTASCDGTRCGITCMAGRHVCDGICALNTAVATCGASCTPCASSPNGTTTCDGTRCLLACQAGFVRCATGCCSPSSAAFVDTTTITIPLTLSVDSTDRLHLVYARSSTSSQPRYATTTGTSWTLEAVGGFTITSFPNFAGRVDSMGRPVVCAAVSSSDPSWQMECTRRVSGVWQLVASQSRASVVDIGLIMASSPSGNFGLLVNQDDSSGFPITQMLNWTGTAFENSRVSNFISSTPSALAYDVDNSPLVTWRRSSDGCLVLSRRAGGTWTDTAVNGSSCVIGSLPAMAVGADGDIHLAYTRNVSPQGNALYARRSGTTWALETIAVTQPQAVTDLDLELGPGGTVHAVWVRAGSISYAMRVDGAWQVLSQFVVGRSPSIAVDSRGGVHIAYVSASTNLNYIHW